MHYEQNLFLQIQITNSTLQKTLMTFLHHTRALQTLSPDARDNIIMPAGYCVYVPSPMGNYQKWNKCLKKLKYDTQHIHYNNVLL